MSDMPSFDWLGASQLALTGISAHMQENIARENLGMQREVLDYQKALQRDLLLREDNAVQRRVADLRKAGLSPVLAAGQGARAGGAVGVSAPQKSMAGAQAMGQVAFQKAQIDMTQAQTALILAQKNQTVEDTRLKAQRYSHTEQRFDHELAMLGYDRQVAEQTVQERVERHGYQTTVDWARSVLGNVDQELALMLMNWVNKVGPGEIPMDRSRRFTYLTPPRADEDRHAEIVAIRAAEIARQIGAVGARYEEAKRIVDVISRALGGIVGVVAGGALAKGAGRVFGRFLGRGSRAPLGFQPPPPVR